MTLVELRQQRGALIEKQRQILAKAEAEKRPLTAEERQEDDRLFTESEALKDQITRRERLEAAERELAQAIDSGARPQPEGRDRREPGQRPGIKPEWRAMIEQAGPAARPLLEARCLPEYGQAFRGYLVDGARGYGQAVHAMTEELRNTLQMDLFVKGGALVAPMEFVARLIQAVDDEVFMRQLATKFTVTMAASMGAPTLDTDVADSEWTSELQTGQQGTMAFGRRELTPHPLAKRVKVSNKLLRASAMSVDGLVTSRLGYKFGLTEEKAFLTGDGAQKPLGVFTASADGIPTARDVQTGSATDLTGDGLIDAKFSIKAAYWPRLRWLLSREAVKRARKLKDTQNQYLWQPGLQAGAPDRIIDTPYLISEHVPATFTTGLYVGIIGDFSQYWIVDALDVTIQRLSELYAETNETGFIGRRELDGQPVLAEAFTRLKTN